MPHFSMHSCAWAWTSKRLIADSFWHVLCVYLWFKRQYPTWNLCLCCWQPNAFERQTCKHLFIDLRIEKSLCCSTLEHFPLSSDHYVFSWRPHENKMELKFRRKNNRKERRERKHTISHGSVTRLCVRVRACVREECKCIHVRRPITRIAV